MRGKRQRPCASRTLDRITPAHAGKTFEFGQAPFGLEDHPRACGENYIGVVYNGV